MVGVICTRIGDVIQDFLAVQSISLCNSENTDWAECTLRVDVQAFTLAAAHAHGKLACHSESVTKLGLSSPELAKEFGHGTGLDAP